MSFLGLRNSLKIKLIDWHLPPSIILAFIAEADRIFSCKDPSEVPTNRRIGMNTKVIVHDGDDSTRRYVFFVRLARDDDDFWIADINCLGVDTANKIFWEPKTD